ncbi:MAG: hypothetical protein U1A07_23180, partial [Phenylobacterium sp.]|nr:hypothetical protein [Phenylobacterium sp.]
MADPDPTPAASPPRSGSVSPAFVRRVLFLVGVGVVLLVAWQLIDVMLLVFGAILVAVLLRALGDPIYKLTPLNEGLSLLAAGLLIISLLSAAGWLFGATVAEQVEELLASLPQSAEELQARLAQLPLPADFLAQLQSFDLASARE